MEAGGVLAVERNRGVRAASLFVVSDELGGEGWNPGFDDPRFLAGKRRARRLLVDVILRRGALGSLSVPSSGGLPPGFGLLASPPHNPDRVRGPASSTCVRR